MRKAGLILSIAGVLLMGYAVYEVASGRIYQAWRGRQLDRELDSLPPQPQPQAATLHLRPRYEEGSAIGRLEIPRLGLSVVVLEGSDTDTLRLGVGRMRSSALPSEAGNVVLAGHRDTFFRSLRDIRKGDQISLRTPEGSFPYTVDWTSVVNPKETSVIMPTASPALTLVTCYPFYYIGSAPQRFIVRALPAGTMSSAAPAEVAPRRPSPFDAPAKAHAAARPPVEIAPTAAAVAQPAPAPPSAAVLGEKPEPVATASVRRADDPPDANPQQPRKGALKRAFHKISGVFSSHRDKLQ